MTAGAVEAGPAHRLGESVVDLQATEHAVLAVGADGAVALLAPDALAARWCVQVDGGPLVGRISLDGRRVIVGTTVGAQVLDAADGSTIAVIDGGWCQTVAWASDGLAALGAGRWAAVVDSDGAPVWSAEATSTVTGVAWAGRRIAVASYGGVVLHEPRTRRIAQTMPFTGSLLALVVSPNGRWVVTGNQDATLHAWRVGRDDDELAMHGYPTKITSLSFSADSRFLACNGSPEVSVWDFAGAGPSGTTPRVVRGHTSWVNAVAFAPRGARVATAGRDGRVLVADCTRCIPGTPMAGRPVLESASPVTALAWLDAGLVLSGGDDGVVRAHDADEALGP